MRLYLIAASTLVLAGCSVGGGDYMSSYAPSGTSASVYSGCSAPAPTAYYGQGGGCGVQHPTPVYQEASCGSPCGAVQPEYYVPQPPANPCAAAEPVHIVYAPPTPCSSGMGYGYAAAAQTPPLRGPYSYSVASQRGYQHNGHGPAYHTGKPAFTHSRRRGYVYGELGAIGVYGIDDVNAVFGGVGRLGYNSKYNIGVEIEGAKGLVGDDVVVTLPGGDEPASFELEQSLAAFGVVRLPIGEVTGLLRGGYHESEFSLELDNFPGKVKEKDKGFAVGAGVELPMSDRSALRFDTTYYDTKNNDTFLSSSLTYQRKF